MEERKENPIFNWFGGRKYFYSLLGVGIIVFWCYQTNDFSQEKLMLVLGILGVGIAGNTIEDGMKGRSRY